MKKKSAYNKNQKAFFIVFEGLSGAKNCLRPETAPLTIVAIKWGFSFNFMGHRTYDMGHFMGHSGMGLKFQLLLICKSSKFSSYNPLKNMSKIPISPYIHFALYSKSRLFSITWFDILIFCNILHLEIDFGNLYKKMKVFS